MAKKVKPIPKGYHVVTPSLNQADAAQTIEFCKKAFGAKIRMRMDSPNGKVMHAEIEIGDSVIMLNDAMQEPPQPAGIFLYVPDVDKTMAKAVKAGASVIMPAQDMFWGDRFGRVEDPSGNRWGIATHREDVPPRELKKRVAAMAAGPSA
ncbi:MAG TPA: VOC family protein [Candidatus Eisenbacteria bacterium]|nr:VOC family protein [Candidatus Eisenbacteria bacterium]